MFLVYVRNQAVAEIRGDVRDCNGLEQGVVFFIGIVSLSTPFSLIGNEHNMTLQFSRRSVVLQALSARPSRLTDFNEEQPRSATGGA